MKKIFIAVTTAILLSCPVFAATLEKGMPACLSEDLYRQLLAAAVNKDMQALNWLASNGCAVSTIPLHATVLAMSDDGILTRVRLYRGKVALEMWVAPQSLDQP